MSFDGYRPSVVDFAYEIIDLHEQNIQLRKEVEHYKHLYELHAEQTRQGVEHGEKMMGLMLKGILNGNIVPTPKEAA
jgi:hypothetical protein